MSAVPVVTQVGLSAIQAVVDRAQLLNQPMHDSLVAFTQAARVEPNVLVDTDVLFVDELHDVMQSLQTLFAGYYLQAVALNSTIGNVKVMKTLEKFTPTRNLGSAVGDFAGSVAGVGRHILSSAQEAYRDRLPSYIEDHYAMESEDGEKKGRQVDPDEPKNDRDHKRWKQEREKASAQREDDTRRADDEDRLRDRAFKNARQDREKVDQAREEAERARVAVSFGKDAISDLKENANLSVGKLIEVNVKHEDKTFTIPVSIRLIANTIPTAKLVHILSLANEDTSSSERYHGWRSGRLSFVKDLIFCRDLIDAHRRNLMANGDALYHNILSRQRRNTLSAILSGNPSVGDASNMVVTSTSSIEELELSLGGKFSDFHTRQKVFEKTSLMIIAVIDKEWARVTFYTRGLAEHTDVSFRDIKAGSKSGGPDVSDILKAYQLGNSPSL